MAIQRASICCFLISVYVFETIISRFDIKYQMIVIFSLLLRSRTIIWHNIWLQERRTLGQRTILTPISRYYDKYFTQTWIFPSHFIVKYQSHSIFLIKLSIRLKEHITFISKLRELEISRRNIDIIPSCTNVYETLTAVLS